MIYQLLLLLVSLLIGQKSYVDAALEKTVIIEHPTLLGTATGAGVWVTGSYVLTANHMTDGLLSRVFVRTRLPNGVVQKLVGWTMAKDPGHDLALVVVPPVGVERPYARLGDQPERGDILAAVGHPGGLYWTFTTGVTSGIKRWGDFIISDLVSNPGNSGGPVFNTHGKLVGIVIALIGPFPFGGFYQGQTIIVPPVYIKPFLEACYVFN